MFKKIYSIFNIKKKNTNRNNDVIEQIFKDDRKIDWDIIMPVEVERSMSNSQNHFSKSPDSEPNYISGSKLLLHACTYSTQTMGKWLYYKLLLKHGSVISKTSTANEKQISENRNYIKYFIDIVIYFGRRQGFFI